MEHHTTGPIYNSITDLIGRTPLLRLNTFTVNRQLKAGIIAKVEYFNPGGSVKDRTALAMIEDAEKRGILKKGGAIIEPTSGNTGVGLSLVGAARGYRVILTMPDTMSEERRKLASAFGAEIVLTPGAKGMTGAINKAEELRRSIPGAVTLQQFENASNPRIHSSTTGKELVDDALAAAIDIDAFVAGVGTGGTISGVAKTVKAQFPMTKIFAVEPDSSAVLSGEPAGTHKIQGIGAGFVPKNYDKTVVDEVIRVTNTDAFHIARCLAREEGLLVGISSGAAVHAATVIARRREFYGKNIFVLLPDTGERYLSTDLFTTGNQENHLD